VPLLSLIFPNIPLHTALWADMFACIRSGEFSSSPNYGQITKLLKGVGGAITSNVYTWSSSVGMVHPLPPSSRLTSLQKQKMTKKKVKKVTVVKPTKAPISPRVPKAPQRPVEKRERVVMSPSPSPPVRSSARLKRQEIIQECLAKGRQAAHLAVVSAAAAKAALSSSKESPAEARKRKSGRERYP
jgi:hypothetical protein